jgi:replicative DNA helicase
MTGRDEDEPGRVRVPPWSAEAEQSLLGGLMLDNSAWDRVGYLVPKDFYRLEHRLVFDAIGCIVNANRQADVITVFERLQSTSKGPDAVELSYLDAMVRSTPSAANVHGYARIIREKAIARNLIASADEASSLAWHEELPIEQRIEQARALLDRIELPNQNETMSSIDDLVVKVIDQVNESHERGEQIGSPTGIEGLDALLDGGGWLPGLVYTLAGRPSVGKSSLAGFFGVHQALHRGVPTLKATLEMGKLQLTYRSLATVGDIDHTRLRSGQLDDFEWGRLAEAVEKLGKAPLWIDEMSSATVQHIRRKAKSIPGLGLIVVDYLQLMGAERRHDTRAGAIGEISRGMKQLAKELNCAVLQLSQLNRVVDTRPGGRPIMSDLRESGDIEQDSDVVMFLRRFERVTSDCDVIALEIGKQRDGKLGEIPLIFHKSHHQWSKSTADLNAPAKEPSK